MKLTLGAKFLVLMVAILFGTSLWFLIKAVAGEI